MLKMAVVEDIKEDSDTLCGYVEKFSEETAERIDIRVSAMPWIFSINIHPGSISFSWI